MGKFGPSTPDPNWGEDLTLLQDYCIHMQKKTSMFPLRFALQSFWGPGKPHQEPPLWARVNLHKRVSSPCGWVLSLSRKVSQSFSR
jgi:hypothetical protein